MITDIHGRQFKKLRVSLTSECNFSCLYCTGVHHEQRAISSPNAHYNKAIDTFSLVDIIEKIHHNVQLESIRLTGGEPLLNPDVVKIIRSVLELGIDDVRLTTNGSLLPQMAMQLAEAGLKSVNVSLDAITPDVFSRMARRDNLEQVLLGIDKAIDAGLHVKINTVVMRGRNDHEIIPLLHFAAEKGIVIRFLELMKMGPIHNNAFLWMVKEEEILQQISKKHHISPIPRKDGSTANYWQLANGQVFGIIANESSPFCGDCNRLRLDGYGNIYGCISTNEGIQAPSATHPSDFISQLQQAMTQKQSLRFIGHQRSMQLIGG